MWAGAVSVIRTRREIVHPELCFATDCIILQILNTYTSLTVHKLGTLAMFHMFHESFLKCALNADELCKLYSVVKPNQPEQERGPESGGSDAPCEAEVPPEELSAQEFDMLSSIDLGPLEPLDVEEALAPAPPEEAPVDVQTPRQLLQHLEETELAPQQRELLWRFGQLDVPAERDTASRSECESAETVLLVDSKSAIHAKKRQRVAWTSEEDEFVINFYNKHGLAWREASRAIGTRSDDACRNRFARLTTSKATADDDGGSTVHSDVAERIGLGSSWTDRYTSEIN
jgi:hypothetical protein